MMRELLASLVLCTFIFMQVELYVITVDNFFTSPNSPITVEQLDLVDYDNDFKYSDVYTYGVTFNTSDPSEDIPLEYFYIDDDDNLADIGQTSLCNADFSTTEGTVAAIVAVALGITGDSVCPLPESQTTQKSVFTIDEGNFSNLPNSTDEDDMLFVKLEVYSSTYMSIKLSITDDDDWNQDFFMEDDFTENSDEE